MRFSLRELLILMTAATLAVPALMFATPWLKYAVIAVTGVVCAVMVDRVLTGNGGRRAAAVGWVAPSLFYAWLVVSGGQAEQDVWNGKLWTTNLMEKPLYWATKPRSYWHDLTNDKKFDEYPQELFDKGAIAVSADGLGGGFGGGGFGTPPTGPQVAFIQVPRQGDFMPIAHSLWTLLFGYAGMKYAQWVHARKTIPAVAESEGVADD